MKKYLILFIFLCLSLFLFFVYNTFIFFSKAEVNLKPPQVKSTFVEIKIAEKKPISQVLSLTGEFFANESVSLQSEVSGRINFIGFSDGQIVKKNESM